MDDDDDNDDNNILGLNEKESEYIHDGKDILSKILIEWDFKPLVGSMKMLSLIIKNTEKYEHMSEYTETIFSTHTNLNVYNKDKGMDSREYFIENIGDYFERVVLESENMISDDDDDYDVKEEDIIKQKDILRALFIIFLHMDYRVKRFIL